MAAQRRQRRAVAEERNQAAEAHRRFVRRLDHELKNPLTAMRIGLADLRNAPLKTDQQETVAGVAAQAIGWAGWRAICASWPNSKPGRWNGP